MLVTNHLIMIQSCMEEIRRYNFHILCIFEVTTEILFYPHALQVG